MIAQSGGFLWGIFLGSKDIVHGEHTLSYRASIGLFLVRSYTFFYLPAIHTILLFFSFPLGMSLHCDLSFLRSSLNSFEVFSSAQEYIVRFFTPISLVVILPLVESASSLLWGPLGVSRQNVYSCLHSVACFARSAHVS